MKSLKTIILFILPILLLASQCNEKRKEPNVMKGRLMYDCDTPAPNKKVLLKADNMKTVEMVDGSKELYTDEDGYFEFRFYSTSSKYMLYAPYKTMAFIPNEKNLDLGKVQLGRTYNCYIRLDVQNPYTENDTLSYMDWSQGITVRIPGPFQSGIIDTMMNVPHGPTGGGGALIYGEYPILSLNYTIEPYNGVSGWGKRYFDPCSSEIYEVVFKIE